MVLSGNTGANNTDVHSHEALTRELLVMMRSLSIYNMTVSTIQSTKVVGKEKVLRLKPGRKNLTYNSHKLLNASRCSFDLR
jgi:hypothetical protein